MRLQLARLRQVVLCLVLGLLGCCMSCQEESKSTGPEIENFSPETGSSGDTVTIHGRRLAEAGSTTIVRFNGKEAALTLVSETAVQAIVPYSATSGKITVSVNAQTGESSQQFSVEPAIYVTGYGDKSAMDETRIARYWRNGREVKISDGTVNAFARAICPVGPDIYIAGDQVVGSTLQRVLWKNGQEQSQATATYEVRVHDASIAGNDVYMSGSIYPKGKPFLRIGKIRRR